MKILSVGNGFIASHLPYQIIPEQLEINSTQIKNILNKYKPDAIINAIGFGGYKNIDDCNTNQEKTVKANLLIPTILAQECYNLNIHMVHISSGCIFNGNSPRTRTKPKDHNGTIIPAFDDPGWSEINTPNPASFYSNTKYACDLAICSLSNVSSLRIRMPISPLNHPRNFINKIKSYQQLIDIPNSITFTDDLVRLIHFIIKERRVGIFNSTNSEPLSAADVMREFQTYVPEHQFEIINLNQLNNLTLAKRSNCLLDNTKLKNAGFTFTNSYQALKSCMKTYIQNYNLKK